MAAATAQMQAQLDAILRDEPQARAVAIRQESAQGLPATISARGKQFAVQWCESRLALREALVQLEQSNEDARLLLVTPLADTDLPADIAARLTRARVFQAREWDVLRPLFGAVSVDARLGKYPWMAQVLIDLSAQGAYAELPSRFLDLDTAWREFLSRGLQLGSARPDALELLQWTLDALVESRLAALPEPVRDDVLDWFGRECGTIGTLVAATLRAGRRMDAVPIAIVCGVLFSGTRSGGGELGRAGVRLERYLADHHVAAQEGRSWAAAAQQLAESQPIDRLLPALERADAVLAELKISEHAGLSPLSPSGLEKRMEVYADALNAHLDAPCDASMQEIESAAAQVLDHRLIALQPLRRERVVMARRLCRWIMGNPVAASDYAALVAWQADEGAFVDWARFRLLGGDEDAGVSNAYARLRQLIAERRHVTNRQFADRLASVNREGNWKQDRALPLEHVLDTLLPPLMSAHPALLLVMDGLSLSIFRELLARPEQAGWREVIDERLGATWIGVATLPTVTESSRGSLLCGSLRLAVAAQEKTAFSAHPALLQRSGKKPPKLFHKAELLDEAGLSAPLREAIADPNQRLVGVVYNAVDDHLSGPEQLHQSWQAEQLRGLMPLLRAARDARRVLILTADHGHVLEDASRPLKGSDSDRWRTAESAALREGERVFEGGRVVSPAGGERVVCLVDEGLRYTGRKNGYHGGASLQEVCVPMSVFLPFGLEMAGWRDASPPFPDWWELPHLVRESVPLAPPRPSRKKPQNNEKQPSLFAAAEPLPAQAGTDGDWVGGLLASSTYLAQKQLAARVALSDAEMRALLLALEERGGKLGWSALAQRVKLSEMRLHGALSAARRVLNIDQSEVLTWDETSRTVALNRKLLEQQFKLAGGSSQ